MVPKEEFRSPRIWSQKRSLVVQGYGPKEELRSQRIWSQKRSLVVQGYGPKRGV